MGSFLPILWPTKEQVIALIFGAIALVLVLNGVLIERRMNVLELGLLTISVVELGIIWSLSTREKRAIEAVVGERTASLSELVSHLQTSIESERLALSQELHDELGALLTMAKIDVSRIGANTAPPHPAVGERIDSLMKTLDSGLALKTRIVEGLGPLSLSHLGVGFETSSSLPPRIGV
jgi:signal transduction histidine kinase